MSEVASNFAYGFRVGEWPRADATAQQGAIAPPAPPAPPQSATSSRAVDLRVGSIQEQQDIYAVYLTAPAK